MTDIYTAARQALEALRNSKPNPRLDDDDYAEGAWEDHYKAITALRSALEQPQQEPDPAARNGWVLREVLFDNGEPVGHREPQQEPPPIRAELLCVCGCEWQWENRTWELVATPPTPPAPRRLTDEEVRTIVGNVADIGGSIRIARAIEARILGEQK